MSSKAKPIICPKCGSNKAAEIWFKDLTEMNELLESHCNNCGWAIDAEGNILNEGDLNRKIPLLYEIYFQHTLTIDGNGRSGERSS